MVKWSKIKLQTWMIKTGKLKVESEGNNCNIKIIVRWTKWKLKKKKEEKNVMC